MTNHHAPSNARPVTISTFPLTMYSTPPRIHSYPAPMTTEEDADAEDEDRPTIPCPISTLEAMEREMIERQVEAALVASRGSRR